MKLSPKTIQVLREIINEKSQYRSGPMLVEFFNDLGFHDVYGQGFPSRWAYTEEKLNELNGTATLDQCIKNVFAPVNYWSYSISICNTAIGMYILKEKMYSSEK